MKRSTFFAGILASLGVAKAQWPTGSGGACPDEHGIGRPCGDKLRFTLEHTPEGGADWSGPRGPAMPSWMWRNKAANGECPVCGTAAEAFTRPVARICRDGADTYICGGGLTTNNEQWSDVPLTPHGPTERTVRCKTCNAAFWQDADA